MHALASRAGRWPLALMLATLGACSADEQPTTAPSAHPTRPSLAVGDVITVTNTKGGTETGSLRWAVAQATGGEIIRFDSRLAGTTITLDSTLVILDPVTIEGPADKGVTISGGGKGRVIDVATMDFFTPTTFRNLSITGGKLPDGGGAGIRNSTPVVLEHSTVWGNEAVAAPAILAIPTQGRGIVMLTNSTVSGNTSTGYGYAAVIVSDALTLNSSTVAYNSRDGIDVADLGSTTLHNSIIASNGGWNCSVSDNTNFEGTNLSDDMSCGDSTALTIGDAKLESLKDNGGPSMTHALTPESPAFNAVLNCGMAVDQRYKPRDIYCDIGAFESTDSTTATVTIDRVASIPSSGSNAFTTGTVKCSRNGDQFGVRVEIQQRAADKTVVQGSGTVTVTCTTTAQPWSALVYPSAGAFRSGSASATAATYQTPSWVLPATRSAKIKLVAP